jgi:predicted TIM-barrel fold metal-dependent hydrolase
MSDDEKSELASQAKKYWSADGYTAGGVIREVDYASQSGGLHPSLKGIKIVDCDTHVTEAPDLFTSQAPAALKAKMPRVKRVNGVDRWFVGDRDFGTLGGNVIRKDNNKLLGRLAFQTIDEGHQGAYLTKERLQAMDDMGVYAQICYQNSGVTQPGSLMSLGDNELAIGILKAYNDGAAARQEESGQRLFTLGQLPVWDGKAMLAEARRCQEMGIKGFVVPDTPERMGLPSLLDDYWTPFLEFCNDEELPLNYHLNLAFDPNAMAWKGFAFEQTLSVVATMFSIGNAATMGNWIVSGRLDRHPKLKIGLIESGMGWIPFVLEALEHQFDEMLASKKSLVQLRPWDYFKRHFWVTYWFEKIAPKQLLETIGVDKVLFETDFPHPTSLYPGVQAHIVDTLGGYSYDVRKRVLERNAAELYKLPF